MKVVFFLLDACRKDYISEENTPFLFEKSKNGIHIEKIIPSSGFCERTEIFFGLKPNESGFFTAIGYDPENGVYKNEKFLTFFGKIESFFSSFFYKFSNDTKNQLDSILHKIIDKSYFKFFSSRKKLNSYKIPHLFLKYFNLTEDNFELHSIDYLKGSKSIFKIIEENGGRTFLGSFTSLGAVSNGDDKNRIKQAVKASKSFDFVPVYINCLDSVGHKFGPNSQQLKCQAYELDQMLELATNEILSHSPDTVFYFLGDHGMTEVKTHLDIKSKFHEISFINNLKEGRDFIYFLDSTIMRIWFFNDKAKLVFEKELKTNSFFTNDGAILNDSIRNKFDIPINDRRYGDMMWWANEGVLIFPDFFHNKKTVKGMHGYKPVTRSTFGTCIVWSKEAKRKKIKELELSNIYDHIAMNFR